MRPDAVRLRHLAVVAAVLLSCAPPMPSPVLEAAMSAPSSTLPRPPPAAAPSALRAEPTAEPSSSIAVIAAPTPGARCDAALLAAPQATSAFSTNRTSMAATKHLLAVFAKACKDSFPSWAEAALLASRGGRKERSKILAHAAVEVCSAAVGKDLAVDVLDACPPTPFKGASRRLWERLDAGTYAFALALRSKGVESTFVDELILQASFNAELDR